MTKKWLIGLIAIAAFAASAQGAIIGETETGGSSANNTLATAQVIPNSAFTLPAPASVLYSYPTATLMGLGGMNDVDFYQFMLNFDGQVFIDVDNDPSTFDTLASLFNATGTLVGWGDDTDPVDAGSQSGIDAMIGGIFLPSGTYYLAISEFPNYATEALLHTENKLGWGGLSVVGAAAGVTSFDFNDVQPTGALPYTVHVSVTPEPGTWALFGMGLGMVALLRRRVKA